MHAFLLLLLLAATPIQVTEPAWVDAPSTMPKGTKMAILEGSPKEAGLFTIRLRLPKGAVIAPHTHPRNERVTILEGRVRVGFGTRVEDTGTTFTAGGFYVNPPGEAHYLTILDDSVLQLTCEGPWEVVYVKE